MRVVTYLSANAPDGVAAIARIRCHAPASGKRKAGEDWHPVIFEAATEEAARERAEAWWAAEIERERKRQENYAAAAERLSRAATARKAATTPASHTG